MLGQNRGRNNEDLTSDALWGNGNREYPNPVVLPPTEYLRKNRSRPVSPVHNDKDISISTLMAILNSKSQEQLPKKKTLYDRPPPLPSLHRPHPPIYPLTVFAEASAKRSKDPIKAYRMMNYPFLQLFENGVPIFPNFFKSIALPDNSPPDQSKEKILKVLAWKYGIPLQSEQIQFHDYDIDAYIEKPKRHRFPKFPARQRFYVRTGLAFPLPHDESPSKQNSFDKPETFQPYYKDLHEPNQKARRFVTKMNQTDHELNFVVDGNSIEISSALKKSRDGKPLQIVEKIQLPKDLHIEKVHFVRNYQGYIVVEEKWEI